MKRIICLLIFISIVFLFFGCEQPAAIEFPEFPEYPDPTDNPVYDLEEEISKLDIDSLIVNGVPTYHEVRNDFFLPTTGPSGSTITWADKSNSSALYIENSSGYVYVYQPDFGSGNASVELVATVMLNGTSGTKTFNLNILEQFEPHVVETLESPGVTYQVELGTHAADSIIHNGYLYILSRPSASETNVAVYNIVNARRPVFVDVIKLSNARTRQIAISGTNLYIPQDAGVAVFDISNPESISSGPDAEYLKTDAGITGNMYTCAIDQTNQIVYAVSSLNEIMKVDISVSSAAPEEVADGTAFRGQFKIEVYNEYLLGVNENQNLYRINLDTFTYDNVSSTDANHDYNTFEIINGYVIASSNGSYTAAHGWCSFNLANFSCTQEFDKNLAYTTSYNSALGVIGNTAYVVNGEHIESLDITDISSISASVTNLDERTLLANYWITGAFHDKYAYLPERGTNKLHVVQLVELLNP